MQDPNKHNVGTDEILIRILNKVTNIEKDVHVLKQDVHNLNNFKTDVIKRLGNIENFIKREADIIETELNKTMIDHLIKTFPGYNIQRYDDKLKTIRNPSNGKLLTEFDGIYLLIYKKTKNIPEKRVFVIVEAKRYTTDEKIKDKLDQLHILKQMIDDAKNKQTILAHKLDTPW